ncbi:MAG: dTMP kinase [Balneolaceae bacterium]|nr:dTMP kinase [Balneolaceae bacterium]
MEKGILVAFEGIDGAGKTTQVHLLGKALKDAGENVIVSKEPTDGAWGQKIRKSASTGRLPLEDELEAFIQDRKEHIENLIAPNLAEGRIVILDRYFYSTVSYQGSRGADFEEVEKNMKEFAPVPDMVFLLDIDPETSLKRIAELRKEIPNQFEKLETLTSVRKVFNAIEKTDDEIWKLDGKKSIELIHNTIKNLLLDNVLHKKRCAKDYQCQDFINCSFRLSEECDWYKLNKKLRPNRDSFTETAFIQD